MRTATAFLLLATSTQATAADVVDCAPEQFGRVEFGHRRPRYGQRD